GVAAPDRGDGRTQLVDLATRVIEVILARDHLTAGFEDATEKVADECAPGIADGERPGRVRRHELHVDLPSGDRLDVPPCARVGKGTADDRLPRRRSHAHAWGARARD